NGPRRHGRRSVGSAIPSRPEWVATPGHAGRARRPAHLRMAWQRLKPELALCRMHIDARAAHACPRAPAGLTDTGKAGRAERRARLRRQNIGEASRVAERICRPATRAVEKGADVWRAVGRDAENLDGPPVVKPPGHGPPDNGDAHNVAVEDGGEGKAAPAGRPGGAG